jgi:GNAT superfamily N-acetyltransferase
MPACRFEEDFAGPETQKGRLELKSGDGENGGEIAIAYLADHPEFADDLAMWSWTEWRVLFEASGRGLEDARRSYRERAQRDALPLALVAFAADRLVGTVSLVVHDLATRPEITPWLASLFVVPEWRRRGVASMLVERAIEEARRLNLPTLFLWTSSAEALYGKLGWRVAERTEHCGKNIVIMQIESCRAAS